MLCPSVHRFIGFHPWGLSIRAEPQGNPFEASSLWLFCPVNHLHGYPGQRHKPQQDSKSLSSQHLGLSLHGCYPEIGGFLSDLRTPLNRVPSKTDRSSCPRSAWSRESREVKSLATALLSHGRKAGESAARAERNLPKDRTRTLIQPNSQAPHPHPLCKSCTWLSYSHLAVFVFEGALFRSGLKGSQKETNILGVA